LRKCHSSLALGILEETCPRIRGIPRRERGTGPRIMTERVTSQFVQGKKGKEPWPIDKRKVSRGKSGPQVARFWFQRKGFRPARGVKERIEKHKRERKKRRRVRD